MVENIFQRLTSFPSIWSYLWNNAPGVAACPIRYYRRPRPKVITYFTGCVGLFWSHRHTQLKDNNRQMTDTKKTEDFSQKWFRNSTLTQFGLHGALPEEGSCSTWQTWISGPNWRHQSVSSSAVFVFCTHAHQLWIWSRSYLGGGNPSKKEAKQSREQEKMLEAQMEPWTQTQLALSGRSSN